MKDFNKNKYFVKADIVKDKDDNTVDVEYYVARLSGKVTGEGCFWVHGEEKAWVIVQVRNNPKCKNVVVFIHDTIKLPYSLDDILKQSSM